MHVWKWVKIGVDDDDYDMTMSHFFIILVKIGYLLDY